MYKLICVSNRTLCTDDFIARIRTIIDSGIPVILREKDLHEDEYYRLLCKIDRKSIIAHTYVDAARKFGCKKIHLPLGLLESTDLRGFDEFGASTHSVEQAISAQSIGASYVTLGHIFATDCKKGVPPRGTPLIGAVKHHIKIPVYAIGGISPNNAELAADAGADGVCIMSGFMRCADIAEYISAYQNFLP